MTASATVRACLALHWFVAPDLGEVWVCNLGFLPLSQERPAPPRCSATGRADGCNNEENDWDGDDCKGDRKQIQLRDDNVIHREDCPSMWCAGWLPACLSAALSLLSERYDLSMQGWRRRMRHRLQY
jgi:hypothetical protein